MPIISDAIKNFDLEQLLDSAHVSREDYDSCLDIMYKRCTMLYKQKPNEAWVVPYNTVLLYTWCANINIQYITGIYGVIAYLTSYLTKPERSMSELMRAASKEAASLPIKEKLIKLGNVFQNSRDLSTHEAIVRTISIPLRRSNIDVQYVPTGLMENITRVIKPGIIKGQLQDPESTDIFVPNTLDKYASRPDSLESMCLADFA